MLEDSLRRRLEALNRGPLPFSPASGATAGSAEALAEPVTPRLEAAAKPVAPRPSVRAGASTSTFTAAGLMRRGEIVETSFGEHLRIILPLDRLWQNGSRLVSARQEFLRLQLFQSQQAVEPTVAFDSEFATLVAAMPDRVLALDLETCGLAGAALFLVGLLRHVDSQPTIELLVARNYAEEAAVLDSLWRIVEAHDVLLTFNGKSFDWPMVVERSVRHRLRPGQRAMLHIDVLHHARRRWRSRLPDCRLQTLETHVCRRRRTGDIPGHRIPGVYADYVKTGFERDMDAVLHHNALDLVTLFDLALRLAA